MTAAAEIVIINTGKDHKGVFMQKIKIFIVGLIALLMSGGFFLIGCGNACDNDFACIYDINPNRARFNSTCNSQSCDTAKPENVPEYPGYLSCNGC